MRRVRTYLSIVMFSMVGVLTGACGGTGDQSPQAARRAHPTSSPAPTRAAVGAWGRGFDAEENFPDYTLTLVGVSWVQLDHRENENTTIVVGFEPSAPRSTLQAALDEHLQQFEVPAGTSSPQSGSTESEILGKVLWARSYFDTDGVEMTQLALFADHPSTDTVLIGRSEFPSESDDAEAKLQELVRAAEIIGPGL